MGRIRNEPDIRLTWYRDQTWVSLTLWKFFFILIKDLLQFTRCFYFLVIMFTPWYCVLRCIYFTIYAIYIQFNLPNKFTGAVLVPGACSLRQADWSVPRHFPECRHICQVNKKKSWPITRAVDPHSWIRIQLFFLHANPGPAAFLKRIRTQLLKPWSWSTFS